LNDVLVQIGRTAFLCGILGLALYFAMSYAARFPAFAPGLAFVGSLAVAWLMASSIRYTLRNRLIPMKVRSISRDEQPVLYWAFLGLEIACGCASIAIAILSVLRLISGADGGT
jgi:hypothetical protein